MTPTPSRGQVRSKPPQVCRKMAEPPKVRHSLGLHPPALPQAPPPHTALIILGLSQPLLLSSAHRCTAILWSQMPWRQIPAPPPLAG